MAARLADLCRERGASRALIVTDPGITRLASDAMLPPCLLVNNPREVGEADALAIYRAAY